MMTKVQIKLLSVFFAVAMLMLGTNAWAEKNCRPMSGTSDVQFTQPLIPGTPVAFGTVTLETTKGGGDSWSGDATIILLQVTPLGDGTMKMLVRLDFDLGSDGSLSLLASAVLAPTSDPGEYVLTERALVIDGTGDFADAYGSGTAVGTASFNTGMAHVKVMGVICTP